MLKSVSFINIKGLPPEYLRISIQTPLNGDYGYLSLGRDVEDGWWFIAPFCLVKCFSNL